jgi:hypothetical protein
MPLPSKITMFQLSSILSWAGACLITGWAFYEDSTGSYSFGLLEMCLDAPTSNQCNGILAPWDKFPGQGFTLWFWKLTEAQVVGGDAMGWYQIHTCQLFACLTLLFAGSCFAFEFIKHRSPSIEKSVLPLWIITILCSITTLATTPAYLTADGTVTIDMDLGWCWYWYLVGTLMAVVAGGVRVREQETQTDLNPV